MSGPKGNNDFCFPETLNIPHAKQRGTLRVEGKQNSMLPVEPVIKCFVIPPNSKIDKKKMQKRDLLDPSWHTNLLWF